VGELSFTSWGQLVHMIIHKTVIMIRYLRKVWRCFLDVFTCYGRSDKQMASVSPFLWLICSSFCTLCYRL
jgi:hypothetical protein